ncbi:MAG: YlxR family protein [Acidimicrobiia bacterium]
MRPKARQLGSRSRRRHQPRPVKKERKRGLPVSGQPERSCIGCGRKAAPAALDRIARLPDGSLGVGRREPGRGAWICSGSTRCFDQAVRRKAFERALRRPVTNTEIESLRARLYGAAPPGAQDRPSGAEEQ